jgi:hypothetical protein
MSTKITKPVAKKSPTKKAAPAVKKTAAKPEPKKAYTLTGAAAAADVEKAKAVVAAARKAGGFEMVNAEKVAVGDSIMGGGKREPVRVAAEVKVGKKWVTVLDDRGRVFAYAPVGSKIPRKASA